MYSCKHYLYKNIYNTVLNMNIVPQELSIYTGINIQKYLHVLF